MELFNAHLLIPTQPMFAPSAAQVAQFLEELIRLNAAPASASIRLRKLSGETGYATNANTGEKIPFPRWTAPHLLELPAIASTIGNVNDYVLSISGDAPLTLPPFELYRNSGSRLDPASPCNSTIRFLLRSNSHQLSESWHEHCRTFLLPPEQRGGVCDRCGAIHSEKTEVHARFWIEFIFEGAGLPGFKTTTEPIHPQVLAAAERIFATTFFHGRFFD
jgi:hypothetical protein